MPDPANPRMKTARNEYRVRLSKPFRRLKGAIRTTLIDNDALQLKQDTGALVAAAGDINPSSGFAFSSDAEAQDAFNDWLQRQSDRGVLEVTSRKRVRNGEHFTSRYVQNAYSRGVEYADARLNEVGVDVPDEDLQAMFNRPVPAEELEQLYTRNYDNLKTVTQRMQTNVRRELSTGYSQGWNPRKIARNLNGRVDVSVSDAERLARTEIMNAHSKGSQRRYSEMGVEKVNILGSSPCAKICAPIIADNPHKLDGLPEGGPPLHPNCRCAVSPAIE